MRRTIILAAALAIIFLGLWGTAVIYFDESRLKGIISDRLSEQVGRRVEIVGALRFSLFPNPEIEAENVVIAGGAGDGGPAMMKARNVSMSLGFLPLLRGEFAPGQMQLTGAVIDLGAVKSGDGSSDPLAALRSSARLLSGRSLRLQDVTVVIPGSSGERPRTIRLDFIELDRFSLDQTVAFRFRGDLGDPPIVDDVRVDGRLHVPSSADMPVRLRDMQLHGRLTALDKPLSLTGDLTAKRDHPLRLSLAGGQLRVGEGLFDLSLNYHGGKKPAADLLVSGPELDWPALDNFSARRMNVDLTAALAALSARVDLRSQLQFDRFLLGSAVLSDARIDLRSQAAGLGVNLATVFPGGLAEASGVLTGQRPETLAVDLTLADFGQLLEWLELPVTVDGSGEAELALHWPAEAASAFRLEGRIELWDGHWRIARGDAEPAAQEFDRFSGDVRIKPGYLEIPAFAWHGGELSGVGWAAVELADGTLGGEIERGGPGQSFVTLSGTLAQPRFAPLGPEALEADAGAGGPQEGEPEQ